MNRDRLRDLVRETVHAMGGPPPRARPIALGADHGGYDLKERLKRYLTEELRRPAWPTAAPTPKEAVDYPGHRRRGRPARGPGGVRPGDHDRRGGHRLVHGGEQDSGRAGRGLPRRPDHDEQPGTQRRERALPRLRGASRPETRGASSGSGSAPLSPAAATSGASTRSNALDRRQPGGEGSRT